MCVCAWECLSRAEEGKHAVTADAYQMVCYQGRCRERADGMALLFRDQSYIGVKKTPCNAAFACLPWTRQGDKMFHVGFRLLLPEVCVYHNSGSVLIQRASSPIYSDISSAPCLSADREVEQPYETNCGLWIWAIQIKFDWLVDWLNNNTSHHAFKKNGKVE